ncbi:hypothetical protein QVD17_16700 [Tagetes erecta]|uniref:Uncharacterized protein n=1 Tax=Tagetes erecta TaxID=13708 RepID=A0AAD8P0V6_TARER|nr:hypothetical protein QVD17_16700 [Tagetes erecta]
MLLWTRRQFIDAKLAKNYLLGVSLLAYSRLAVIDLKELKNNMRVSNPVQIRLTLIPAYFFQGEFALSFIGISRRWRVGKGWIHMMEWSIRSLGFAISQYFVDTPPVIDDDSIKLPKLDENTADHVRNGLTSAPQPVVENYELASITLEYRRECMKDSVLLSLTSSQGKNVL